MKVKSFKYLNDKDQEITRLIAEKNMLLDSLNELADKYIANRGSSYEHITCITPERIPPYWQKVKFLLKYIKHE